MQATLTAYRAGYSLDTLKLELIAQRRLTGNEALDINLALNEEELAVRDLWLRLIYLTLEETGESGPAERTGFEHPSEDETGIQPLVSGVVRAHKDGYNIDSFKLELLYDDKQMQDPEQAALLSQWMRIVFLALEPSEPQNS